MNLQLRHVLGLMVVLFAVVVIGGVYLFSKAIDGQRTDNITRCLSGTTGANAAGGAIQSIIDGNQKVAEDAFQSEVTKNARSAENARLRAAVAYYNDRARLNCLKAYPDRSPF